MYWFTPICVVLMYSLLIIDHVLAVSRYYNENPVGCGHPYCYDTTIVFNGNADDYVWTTSTDSIYLRGWGVVDGVIDTTDSSNEMVSYSERSTDPWWEIYLGQPSGVSINSVTLYLPSNHGAHENNGLSVYIDGVLCASNVGPFDEGDVFRVPCQGVGKRIRIVVPGKEKRMRFTEVQVNVLIQPNATTGDYTVSNPIYL